MGKHDSMRNILRNRAIKEYKKAHPNMADAEIGRIFLSNKGKPLSGQRIGVIIRNPYSAGRNDNQKEV